MIQPARVLPSEVLPSNDDSHTSGGLQEHSNNQQYHDYSYVTVLEQKYPSPLLTEDSYLGHQSVHQPQHIYRQTPLQRHNYRYGRSGHYGSYSDPAQGEKIARYLYQRFRASDHYMKYRDRQQKDAKNIDQQKWPDRLELAFFQALVQWPPMGRRKLPHKDKQRGRNELIADYIEELTGEARTRKQVSSHIQVLKPFVEHDPFIMRWLTHGSTKADQSRHSQYCDGRRASTYNSTAATHAARSVALALSPSAVQNLSKVKSSLDVFEPTDFSMFVQRKHGESEHASIERLHTYTSSITQPLQPEQHISSWQSLQTDFPVLYAAHQRRPLDCNILMAEASLGFPDNTFKDEHGVALPGIELGISFLCISRHLPVYATVKCHNAFYKDGHLLDANSTDVRLAQSEDGSCAETQLKFGSTFWAKTLASIAQRLNNDADPAKSKEDMTHHIKSITAIQEIFVMTESKPERLLVMQWRFRLSKVKQGRAYWMRVLLPSGPEHAEPKNDRVDSVYDYSLGFPDATSSQQTHTSQPALQSPFEYDNTSSGSALTSGTWPACSLDDPSTAPQSAMVWNGDDPFDFATAAAGPASLSYDPDLDFTAFDSSAFDFGAAADFAADPASQDYSHDFPHEYAPAQSTDYSSWCASYPAAAFDSQQDVSGTGAEYPLLSAGAEAGEQAQGFDVYGQYERAYAGSGEGQAYGGAGQDAVKGGSSLAGLVHGGCYLASLPQQNHQHQHQHQRQTQ